MMVMLTIIHRVNTLAKLKETPAKYGVEIDVRHNSNSGLYLNHDPGDGENLEEYLKKFKHAFVIFNIKEAGIEQQCIDLAKKYKIPKSRYFLLDVEFPYLYRASRKEGVKEIAVRFSEAEPLEMTFAQESFVDWCWIDTNNILPLYTQNYVDRNDQTTKSHQVRFSMNPTVRQRLGASFKTCLVSPDRWGRPQDILAYRKEIEDLKFPLTAVMVGMEYAHLWL